MNVKIKMINGQIVMPIITNDIEFEEEVEQLPLPLENFIELKEIKKKSKKVAKNKEE